MSFLDKISHPDVVLRIRLLIYGILFIFSFFIFVGAAEMKDVTIHIGTAVEASIECPLYVKLTDLTPPVANCNFPIAVAIIFQNIYIVVRLILLVLLFLGKMTDQSVLFSNIMELVYVLADFLGFMFILSAACILSTGTSETCDHFKCDDSSWHTASEVAQAGAWISFILWLLVFLVGFLFVFRSGRLPVLSRGQDREASSKDQKEAPQQMETPPNNPELQPDSTPRY